MGNASGHAADCKTAPLTAIGAGYPAGARRAESAPPLALVPHLRFAYLSIRQRILGGFVLILLLLVGMAGFAGYGIATIRQEANSVRDITEVAGTIGLWVEHLAIARARVLQFALTENENDKASAQAALKQLAGERGLRILGGEDSAALVQLQASLARYVTSAQQSMDAIDAHRADTIALGKAATELHTIISAIAGVLTRDGNADLSATGVRLIEATLNSTSAASRFLSSRNPADINMAKQELGGIRAGLEDLQSSGGGNSRVLRFVKGAQGPLAGYAALIDALSADADHYVLAAADRQKAADALLQAAAAFRQTASAGQAVAMDAMAEALDTARVAGPAAALAALLAGGLLAWRPGCARGQRLGRGAPHANECAAVQCERIPRQCPRGVTIRRLYPAARTRISLSNSATDNVSALRSGAMPARASKASPPRPRRAPRSIFRRCPKAAAVSASICPNNAGSGCTGCGVRLTTADHTFGGGVNAAGGIRSAMRASQHHWVSTDNLP